MKLMKKTGLIASVVLVSGILIHAVSDEKIGDKAPVEKGYFFLQKLILPEKNTPEYC